MDSVDLICDWKNPYHDSVHEIANHLWKNIEQLEALTIIEKDGEPIESRIASGFEKEYEISWLKFIANLVSIRYPIADFHRQLDGLEMTINVFREKFVIVKPIRFSKILILIVPRQIKLERIVDIILKENVLQGN